MKAKSTWIIVLAALVLGFAFTFLFRSPSPSKAPGNTAPSPTPTAAETTIEPTAQPEPEAPEQSDYGSVTPGTEEYRGFVIDNVLHSPGDGDIHYNVYIPESYDGSAPYALYVTLPGYEGLYFQGVAANIRSEAFGFEAQKYNSEMIILAPQLSDWGETSANQTIALTEYFLNTYNIDPAKVYGNGYSGGGETMSIVVGQTPGFIYRLFAGQLPVGRCLRACRHPAPSRLPRHRQR